MKSLALILVCAVVVMAGQRTKRQLGIGGGPGRMIGGGFGHGWGQYDYNDYYGDYVGDYNYDYYDWICTTAPNNCQLCNILGSECCDPDVDSNCFLPDTCMNSPCLAGGTCIPTRTLDNRDDFTCICMPGLSGKYCQLATDYFVGAQFFAPPPPPIGGIAPLPLPANGEVPYGAQMSRGGMPPGGAQPFANPALPTELGPGRLPVGK